MIAVAHIQNFCGRIVAEGDSFKAANLVTLSRAVLIVPITVMLALDLMIPALVLYIAAALTDLVDGWLARRTGRSSAFGAQLDAWVDNIFSIAILGFIVFAYPGVWVRHSAALTILFSAPVIYLALSYALCQRFLMFHFWSAKLGALLLFCLWPVIALTSSEAIIPIAAAVIAFSRLEQLLFIFRGGIDPDASHGLAHIRHAYRFTRPLA